MLTVIRLLFLAAFFNALSWIILIPIWQYPDEQAHFAQVQDFAELGQVPISGNNTSHEIDLSENILGTQRDGFGINKFTYHPEYRLDYSTGPYGPYEKEITSLPKSARSQLVKNEATLNPPLYYFLGSVFYKFFYHQDLFTRVYAVRLMSLIFFTTTVAVAFKIGQLIFEKNNGLALALASLTAFQPMLISASTGVLPDSLTNLLFSAVLFICLKIIKEGIDPKLLISLFVLIILGSLTRQQFLIALPIVALPIIYQLFRKVGQSKTTVAVLITTVVFVISSYLIPQLRFIRDLAAPEIGRPNLALLLNAQFIDHIVWRIRLTVADVLPWYWGVYKWLSLTLPPLHYRVINRLIILALIGLILRAIIIIRNRRLSLSDLILGFLIIISLIYFVILLIWDYFFRLDHNFSFGIQGRYFFPLITAHMGILLIGFWQIFRLVLKKYAGIGIYALILFFIFFNNFSLFYVASSYYDVSNLSTFIKQVSQYKPLIIKGNTIPMILLLSLTFQSIFIFSLGKYIIKRNVST